MDPDSIDAVDPVTHGSSDDPELLDFSANTNPVVPDGVEAVYEEAVGTTEVGELPDPDAFRSAAADVVGCDAAAVVPTRGGIEAIRLAIAVTVTPGDSVLVPAPSFSEYAREVELQGGTPRFVPAEEIVDTDPADYALAIVCQPNNPTGRAIDPDRLRAFVARCREAGTPLLVDEAFLDFTDYDSLAGAPGVIVARSLTKMYGLPGLRVGYAAATGSPGERLRTASQLRAISAPALAVGTHCLQQAEFVAEMKRRVRSERERLREGLSERFDVFPSEAPFLLLDVGERDVDDILVSAREAGLVLRDARTFRRLDAHVRVAVRLPAENDELLEVLGDV
jgi:histidinol-phosphate/aromatic aminotransferase/cobyric acid decarboxylase-like protein